MWFLFDCVGFLKLLHSYALLTRNMAFRNSETRQLGMYTYSFLEKLTTSLSRVCHLNLCLYSVTNLPKFKLFKKIRQYIYLIHNVINTFLLMDILTSEIL